MPVECHALISCWPFMYLLIATCGPVVCHICASCLPYVGHVWARQRSHVGRTWATVAKKRVAHMCAIRREPFQLPQVGHCHMWALCGPLVECLLGRSPYREVARTGEQTDSNLKRYNIDPKERLPSGHTLRGVHGGHPTECARDWLPPRQRNIYGATGTAKTVCAAQPHAT